MLLIYVLIPISLSVSAAISLSNPEVEYQNRILPSQPGQEPKTLSMKEDVLDLWEKVISAISDKQTKAKLYNYIENGCVYEKDKTTESPSGCDIFLLECIKNLRSNRKYQFVVFNEIMRKYGFISYTTKEKNNIEYTYTGVLRVPTVELLTFKPKIISLRFTDLENYVNGRLYPIGKNISDFWEMMLAFLENIDSFALFNNAQLKKVAQGTMRKKFAHSIGLDKIMSIYKNTLFIPKPKVRVFFDEGEACFSYMLTLDKVSLDETHTVTARNATDKSLADFINTLPDNKQRIVFACFCRKSVDIGVASKIKNNRSKVKSIFIVAKPIIENEMQNPNQDIAVLQIDTDSPNCMFNTTLK